MRNLTSATAAAIALADRGEIVCRASRGNASSVGARVHPESYNQRPTWLDRAHCTLDQAALAAYSRPLDISDDEILTRLGFDQQCAEGTAYGGQPRIGNLGLTI